MKKGNIVLVPFPFSDLSQTKFRPSIVLWVDPFGKDVTLCFVSSQKIGRMNKGEFLIDIRDSDFSKTGLKVSSKVKVTKVTTLERTLATRRLGSLGDRQIHQLNLAIFEAFQLQEKK